MPSGGVPIPIFLRIHHLGIAPSPVPDCRPIEPQGWAVTFVPGVLFFDFRPQNDDFVMTLLVTRYLYPFMFFCFHFFSSVHLLIDFSENCPLNLRRGATGWLSACGWRQTGCFGTSPSTSILQAGGKKMVPCVPCPLEWENFLVPYCKLSKMWKSPLK